TVAGVASHVLLAIPEGAVDGAHHDNHSAGDHLLLLFIGGPILDVAVGAGSLIEKPQPLHEGLHREGQISSLKHLDVFSATTAALRRTFTAAPFTAPLTFGRSIESSDRKTAGILGQIRGN